MTCLMTKTSVDQCSLHGCANVCTYLFGEEIYSIVPSFNVSDFQLKDPSPKMSTEILSNPLISQRVSLTEMGFKKLKLLI